MSERIDKALVNKGLCRTRAQAQDAIKEGRVFVNQICVLKNSYLVEESDALTVQKKELNFASRAGQKLYDVLEPFGIDLQGRVVIDVGASHGGFSDVCLQANAAYIYAVDVGKDQLLPHLKEDPRVCNMEQTNCRYLEKTMFEKPITFACMDVSFISIRKIFPALKKVVEGEQEMVLLIKPQFEAGKQDIGKHGIVKDEKVHLRVLQEMITYFNDEGFYVHHLRKSSILGRDGNKEFVIHISNKECQQVFPLKQIVKE